LRDAGSRPLFHTAAPGRTTPPHRGNPVHPEAPVNSRTVSGWPCGARC